MPVDKTNYRVLSFKVTVSQPSPVNLPIMSLDSRDK